MFSDPMVAFQFQQMKKKLKKKYKYGGSKPVNPNGSTIQIIQGGGDRGIVSGITDWIASLVPVVGVAAIGSLAMMVNGEAQPGGETE
jgi:hypothetical protein